MTIDELTSVCVWLGEVFPHLTGEQVETAGDSFAAFPADVVRRAIEEQARTRKWFDLPILLKRCDALSPPPPAPTEQSRRQAIERADDRRRRQLVSRESQLIERLTEEQLAEAKAAALAHAPEWVARQLRDKDPRQSVWLASLIVADLHAGESGRVA